MSTLTNTKYKKSLSGAITDSSKNQKNYKNSSSKIKSNNLNNLLQKNKKKNLVDSNISDSKLQVGKINQVDVENQDVKYNSSSSQIQDLFKLPQNILDNISNINSKINDYKERITSGTSSIKNAKFEVSDDNNFFKRDYINENESSNYDYQKYKENSSEEDQVYDKNDKNKYSYNNEDPTNISSKNSFKEKTSNSKDIYLPKIAKESFSARINNFATKSYKSDLGNKEASFNQTSEKQLKEFTINQIVKEVKDEKLSSYHNQLNIYNNNSKVFLMSKPLPIKKTKGKKSKKDKGAFLTDLEILQNNGKILQANSVSKENKSLTNSEAKLEDAESSKKSEYLANQEKNIKDMFKYIDADDLDVTNEKDENIISKYDLDLEISSNDNNSTKQDKEFLLDMFKKIDLYKQLKKEREDEIKTLIRITKQTSSGLDRHFESIRTLYKKAGYNLNEEPLSSYSGSYSSKENDPTSDIDDDRPVGRFGNVNDDPVVLSKNLNKIKDSLLNVTGNVVGSCKNFSDKFKVMKVANEKYKNEMNENSKPK